MFDNPDLCKIKVEKVVLVYEIEKLEEMELKISKIIN